MVETQETVCGYCQQDYREGKTGRIGYKGLPGYNPNKWVFRRPVTDDTIGRFSHGACKPHYDREMKKIDEM
jgi:hypothetical protein